MVATMAGLALGFAVGALCRAFDIPSPAPPRITGSVILIAMTLGYIVGGYIVAGRVMGTP
jgi:XapX domain-containing protein